jgi:hypothetical protein
MVIRNIPVFLQRGSMKALIILLTFGVLLNFGNTNAQNGVLQPVGSGDGYEVGGLGDDEDFVGVGGSGLEPLDQFSSTSSTTTASFYHKHHHDKHSRNRPFENQNLTRVSHIHGASSSAFGPENAVHQSVINSQHGHHQSNPFQRIDDHPQRNPAQSPTIQASDTGLTFQDNEDSDLIIEPGSGSGFDDSEQSLASSIADDSGPGQAHHFPAAGSDFAHPGILYPETDHSGGSPNAYAGQDKRRGQVTTTVSSAYFDIVEAPVGRSHDATREKGGGAGPDVLVGRDGDSKSKEPSKDKSLSAAMPEDSNKPNRKSVFDDPLEFLMKPGILAALIGGALIGILAAILLVFIIVRRMHRKDEGTYVLDDPLMVAGGKLGGGLPPPSGSPRYGGAGGYPYYSYQRAPAREFYA